LGFVVVPTVVIDGTTVVPFTVLMQVFWQLNDWLLQPPRQVADVEVVGAGVAGAVVGAVVSCALQVPMAAPNAAPNAMSRPPAKRIRVARIVEP
jgi:hypothetical protein